MPDDPSLSEILKNHFRGACLAPNPNGTGPKILAGEMSSPAAEATVLLGQQKRLQEEFRFLAPWGVKADPAIDALKKRNLGDCQNPDPKTSKLEFPSP